jgi:hypothetical protein
LKIEQVNAQKQQTEANTFKHQCHSITSTSTSRIGISV